MAYRYEQTEHKTTDLVFDGWESGIAASPYKGIANIRNLNTSFYPGVAYVNYRRQSATINLNNVPAYDNSDYIGTVSVINNIAFDAASNGNTASGTSLTVSHVVGSGLNRALFVSVSVSDSTTVSAITFNGASILANLITSVQSNSFTETTYLFYVLSPATGAHNIVATASGTAQIQLAASSYSGVKQSGIPDAMATSNTDAATSLTQSATSVSDNCWFISAGWAGNGTMSAGVGVTLRTTQGSGPTCGFGDSNGAIHPAGSYSMTMSWGSSTAGALIVAAIAPVSSNTLTKSYTCSGINRLLIVQTSLFGGTTTVPTSVTYNGVSMTKLVDAIDGSSKGQSLWYLINPSSGSNSIVVTASVAPGTYTLMANAISYTGVLQSGFPDASATTTVGGVSSKTMSVTTVLPNCLTLMALMCNPNTTITTSSTSRQDNTSNSNELALIESTAPILTPGSTSLTATFSGSVTDVTGIMVSIAPIAPSAGMTNPLHKAISPAGIIYILDDTGQIWKQTAVASSSFGILGNGNGRQGNGHGGLAYWNNYLVVFGDGMIEFCGDGTGDAAVTSANWNIKFPASSVQVTSSLTLFSTSFTGIVHSGDTSATLASAWTGVSGTYTAVFDNGGLDSRNVVFTNGSTGVSWSGALTGDTPNPGQISMYQLKAVGSTVTGSPTFFQNIPVVFTTTGTLPTHLSPGVIYYLNSNVDLSGATIFTVSANIGDPFIALTDAGTGTHTMSLIASTAPPIVNTTISGFSWGTAGQPDHYLGATTITMTSPWTQASGLWNLVDALGNNLLAAFTYQSNIIQLVSPAVVQPTGPMLVQILNPSAPTYKTWSSKVDGNLYFANGRSVGRILSENTNITFNAGDLYSYVVDYTAVALLQPEDTVVDMVDLKSTLVVAGNFDTYTWDYVSPNMTAPSPVGEQIVRITNLLSNVYILAGTKGNVYVSNGYSNQLLTKIPDFLAGGIDPIWSYGDIMVHRSKIWFQAEAQTSLSVNVLAGIFSIAVSPSILGETATGLVMESQNSYGLTPASGAKSTGCLIDYEAFSPGYEDYYSAWSDGASLGGIDFNDTTLWQNFEPQIETDMVPAGGILEKHTYGTIEFKLDRPMATGDQIRMYSRTSLTDSYTLMGTTTTATLSDYYTANIDEAQWVQFLIQFKCASSGSSFIPLREVRLHFN